MLDLRKLLVDVFEPEEDEVVTVMVDEPHGAVGDHAEWRRRREMAARWRDELVRLGSERGFQVNPMLTFPATGANNADLPARASLDGRPVDLGQTLRSSTLVLALTEYSATAPLTVLAEAMEDFRAASMPGVSPSMEETALAADYGRVAARCRRIDAALQGAVLLEVVFSTGHRCTFDLRHRRAEVDDGQLPRGKPGDRVINLPSGETFIVPYEGELENVPSWTAGTIPVIEEGETVLFQVVGNRVVLVEGSGPVAERYAEHFADDPARTNIAEVAFGVNDRAQVTGSVIEDEKAGFHWAFGRSDHLGGVFGVDRFRSPETVVHQDIVYARGNPVQVLEAEIVHDEGRRTAVIRDGEYLLKHHNDWGDEMVDETTDEQTTLTEAVERRGPFAVWDLMTEDEQLAAAEALWTNADRESRSILELTLAKELKFRPQSVRRLSAERVVGRLVRLAESVPENVLFQFLFHLHMAERRDLMTRFLDQVGLPHDNGVLELAEDADPPDSEAVATAARELVTDEGHDALVYLATLKVADGLFWSGLDPVLDDFREDGVAAEESKPSKKPKKPAAKKGPAKSADKAES